MKPRRSLLLPTLAVLLLACSAPASANNGSCEFRSTGLALNFGALDPSNAVQVVRAVQPVNAGANEAGNCRNLTMDLSVVGASSRQLTETATGATIPYTLAGLPLSIPAPGNNQYVNFLTYAPGGLAGIISSGTYADAPAGTYTDTVTISVSP